MSYQPHNGICPWCGNALGSRRRIGPTGNNDFIILVESCYRCERVYPVQTWKLGWKELRWIDRLNGNCVNDDFIHEKEMEL